MDALRKHVEQVPSRERMVYISESTTLSVSQRHVVVTAAATITLPPVSEAEGAIYTIVRTGTGSVAIAVNSADTTIIKANAAAAATNITLSVALGHAVLMSDGVHWIAISLNTANS